MVGRFGLISYLVVDLGRQMKCLVCVKVMFSFEIVTKFLC